MCAVIVSSIGTRLSLRRTESVVLPSKIAVAGPPRTGKSALLWERALTYPPNVSPRFNPRRVYERACPWQTIKQAVVSDCTHRWRSVRNLGASSSTAVSQRLPGAEKLAAARPSVRDLLRGCWGPRGWRLSRSATKSGDFARPHRPPPRHTILRRYCSLLWPCTTQHDIRVKH